MREYFLNLMTLMQLWVRNYFVNSFLKKISEIHSYGC